MGNPYVTLHLILNDNKMLIQVDFEDPYLVKELRLGTCYY